ncbi:MAG: hemerythrin domain-containing protein [Candidatus Solibacter sp.]
MPIVIGAKRESGFTDPIGMLADCHRRVERFLDVLVLVAERAHGQSLTEEQRSAFDTALRYFREAAPKHTADEEESLFPRLRRLDGAALAEVLARVDTLEEEHVCADRAHAEADRLGQLWLREGSLSPDGASRLIAVVKGLREMYRHHIAVEESEVFPAAAEALSAADHAAIGSEMASRRHIATEKQLPSAR